MNQNHYELADHLVKIFFNSYLSIIRENNDE